MSALSDTGRVLVHAARAGYHDYRVIYTWKTWLVGWYLRVVAQVAFYALIGELLGDRGRTHYLLIGSSVLLALMTSLFAVPSTAWERWAGTLPLLVASPTSAVAVFAGRSVVVIGDAVLTALAAFFLAAPLFGLALPWPRVLLVPPLVLLVAVTAYALGLFLGGLVLRATSMRNVASNLAQATLLAIGGVVVPVAFYPAPVQWVAHALPLTHGLQAVRDLLVGEPLPALLPNVGLELLVGLGWLAAALVTFDRLAASGRRDGSIEFG